MAPEEKARPTAAGLAQPPRPGPTFSELDEAWAPPAPLSWPTRVLLRVCETIAWPFMQLGQALAALARSLERYLDGPQDPGGPGSQPAATPPSAAPQAAVAPRSRSSSAPPSYCCSPQTASPPRPSTPASLRAPLPAALPAAANPPSRALRPPQNSVCAAYLNKMAMANEWGGELELSVLARLHNVQLEVWSFLRWQGEVVLQCMQVYGTEAADARGTVALLRDNDHYQALYDASCDNLQDDALSYPAASLPATPGEFRPAKAFLAADVPALGDCMFLAFAYGVGLPGARPCINAFNWERQEEGGGDLPGLRPLLQRMTTFAPGERTPVPKAPSFDAHTYHQDLTLLKLAIDQLAAGLRAQVVEELHKPEYEDAIVAVSISDAAEL